jgi:hypothetical protein
MTQKRVKKAQTADKSRSRWFAGMMAGQVFGFAAVLAVTTPALPVLLGAIVAGGMLGGLAGSRIRRKPAPTTGEVVRFDVFQALADTNKKLREMLIEEEFNGAASGNSTDRFRLKNQPELKVAPPTIAPKMGGM